MNKVIFVLFILKKIITIIIIIINTGLSLRFQVAGLSGKVASHLSHKSSCNCYV